jgi:SAM-dependent methyltransferase
MLRNIYIYLRNNISKTRFFWKYRHLFEPSIWKGYQEDYNSDRRDYYFNLIKTKKLNSIFEFGCASGPNFFSIKKNIKQFIYYGYDISNSAIKSVKNQNNDQVIFTNKLSKNHLKNFLDKNTSSKFDLTIFDRVLYMLNENQIIQLLDEISEFLDYVLIEDFYALKPTWDNEKYIFAKNYINIFKQYGFILIENNKSKMKSSSAQNFARRILLKRK